MLCRRCPSVDGRVLHDQLDAVAESELVAVFSRRDDGKALLLADSHYIVGDFKAFDLFNRLAADDNAGLCLLHG